jgi:hypothetical protein
MTSRPLRKLGRKPVLRPEDVDAAIHRLRLGLADIGKRLAQETAPEPDDDRPSVEVPDLTDRAEQALRALLEEETYALVEPEGPRGIAAHELHHELLKKALVGLKRPVLRELVSTRGMEPESKLDDLARQVAASYDWDETAIARLVLDYAEDPRETEGGPTTRIFALAEPIDLARIEHRLAYVNGRYYRTDIAKWFTFERYQRIGSVLKVAGTLQTYRAGVDPVAEDRLKSEQDISSASLDVTEGGFTARVHDASTASAARSMLAAFRVATTAKALEYVPNSGSGADIRPRALHPSTEFLLDLVTHRLRGRLFRQRNPVLARFRYTKSESTSTEDSAQGRKPSLRAVRFEGKNLLDSTTACGLMWTEGRPLVDLTVEVAVTAVDDDQKVLARIPVRLALEKDHVLVATGLSSSAEVMAEVHRSVLDHVERAITEGVPADHRIKLERTIRNRAQNPDPDADAELLGDGMEMI